MKAEKILVVDDDDSMRRVIAEMLSRLGYAVSSAESGAHGLNNFNKGRFDIVLSDYQMPGMDGIALAGAIKKSSPLTPVIIMTGAAIETVLSRKSPAVDEVISKPFSLKTLDITIRSYTGRSIRALSGPPL